MIRLPSNYLLKLLSITKRYSTAVTTRKVIDGFNDNENNYYSEALVKLAPNYNQSPCLMKIINQVDDDYKSHFKLNSNVNYFNQSPEFLYKMFMSLTKLVYDAEQVSADLENSMYYSLCKAMANSMRQLSDAEVCDLLTCLTLWPTTNSARSNNFKTLWNYLDRECSVRAVNWDTEKLIQVACMWNKLGLSRITNYNYVVIDIMCSKMDTLDIHSFIHLLFFINLQRKVAPKFMAEIEKQLLLRNVEHLTMDQIGVVSLSYFKTQTPIVSKNLITQILAKVQLNFNFLNSFNVTSVAKMVRHSTVNRQDLILASRTFQEKSLSYLSNFSASTVLHLAMMNIRHLACDEMLLKYMMESFVKSFKSLRLKELSQSVFCISQILPNSEESRIYVEKVMEELRSSDRQQEIALFPHQLISALLCAAYVNVFPVKLVSYCLSDEYLKQAEDNARWEWEREAFVLDASLALECPNYIGNRMSEARKSAIYKRHKTTSMASNHTSFINEVVKNISNVLGGQNVCYPCHILPYFHHKDIIIIKDKNNRLKPIPSHVSKAADGCIIKPNAHEIWSAVFVGGRNFYNSTNNRLIGSHAMKCRQLQKLGYNVIEVPYYEYFKLNNDGKAKYLRKKLGRY